MYIKVNPKKCLFTFGKYSKLAPRYCGPFDISAKVGPIAYHLSLPTHIKVHNVFHISILKIKVHDVSHVIDWNVIQVKPEGELQVGPERILDRREILPRNSTIG